MAAASRRIVSASTTPGTKTQSARPRRTGPPARPSRRRRRRSAGEVGVGAGVQHEGARRRRGPGGRDGRRPRRCRTAPRHGVLEVGAHRPELDGPGHGAGDILRGVAVPGLEVRGTGTATDPTIWPTCSSILSRSSAPSGPAGPGDARAGRGDGREADLLEDAGGPGSQALGSTKPGPWCRARKPDAAATDATVRPAADVSRQATRSRTNPTAESAIRTRSGYGAAAYTPSSTSHTRPANSSGSSTPKRCAVLLDPPAEPADLREREPARGRPRVPGLAQVVAERAAPVGAVRHQGGHLPSQRDERLVRGQPGGRVVRLRVQSLGELLQVGEHQLVLAGEVPVEHVLAGAGRLDQLAHADGIHAALVEEPVRRAQDAVACGGVGGSRHRVIVSDRSFRKVCRTGNDPRSRVAAPS